MPVLDREPQRLTFADKMLLPDEPAEIQRPYPIRKRLHNSKP